MYKIVFFILTLSVFQANGQDKKKLVQNGNKMYSDSSYNEAEINYRKALEKDQEYFKAKFNMGDAIYKQGRYNESTAIFKALANEEISDKERAYIYHNLGNSLLKEQKIKEAIASYKNALRTNPNDEDTRYNLVYAQQMLKQQEQQEEEQQEEEQQEEEEEEE